jgi:hypothetical protein
MTVNAFHQRGRRWPAFLACVVVAAIAGGGIAAAEIPDSSGVIHACYDTKGAVHLIDPTGSGGLPTSCVAGETALNFNQSGPAGPPGLTGPTGATGPAGTASAVYDTGFAPFTAVRSLTQRGARLYLTLPAGSYAITARASLIGYGGERAQCELWVNSSSGGSRTLDEGIAELGGDVIGTHSSILDGTPYMPLESSLTLPSSGIVTMECDPNGSVAPGELMSVTGMRIMAVSVGSAVSVPQPIGAAIPHQAPPHTAVFRFPSGFPHLAPIPRIH